jgi:hypothetical protein
MADVEVALLAFFDDLAYTVTVTPGDLGQRITDSGGVLRIRRIGGGADRDNDTPTISVQAFAAESYDNPRAAHDLDAQVWDRFLDILNGDNPGWVGGVVIEDPSKTSGPVELPYPDPAITVVESIYRLTVRT